MGRTKWRFCTTGCEGSVTGLLSTIGRIAALAVSSRSSRRSYYVRQVGGGYVGPGLRGCPVTQDDQSAPPAIWRMRWRFTGANTKRSGGSPSTRLCVCRQPTARRNRHLAVRQRLDAQTSSPKKQLSPTKFVRADPRSRYGRKSGFLPQGDWPVHPDALPVRPVT